MSQSRWVQIKPRNDAELFDMIHALFGIGDFDDSAGVPWFQHRMNEAGKLKAMRKARQISIAELAMSARYCYRHRLTVNAPWQLRGFIVAARQELRTNTISDLGEQIRDALEVERTLPGRYADAWIERLLLARGSYRAEVLAEWKRSREDVTTSVTEGKWHEYHRS